METLTERDRESIEASRLFSVKPTSEPTWREILRGAFYIAVCTAVWAIIVYYVLPWLNTSGVCGW